MKPTLKEQGVMILQSIRELREIYGPVSDYRIKRQLVNTRRYCRTVKPEYENGTRTKII